MTDIVIASAARTPVGSFNGAFANTPAHELGAVAIKAALARSKVEPQEVDEVILGQVLSAGQGQNPARQAAMKAGIPQDKTAFGIDQVCSKLRWPFPIVVATPDPEIEAWIVSGFTPRDQDEQARLEHVRRDLSFDPTLQSHLLTSHPNNAAADAKRVLSRLCRYDREREDACLERDILRDRGHLNGAHAFLDDVDQHVLPIFRSQTLMGLLPSSRFAPGPAVCQQTPVCTTD